MNKLTDDELLDQMVVVDKMLGMTAGKSMTLVADINRYAGDLQQEYERRSQANYRKMMTESS